MPRRSIDWSAGQRLAFLLSAAAAAVVLPLAGWLLLPGAPGGETLRAKLGLATALGLAVLALAGLSSLRAMRRRVRHLESAAKALAAGDPGAARSVAEPAGPEPQRDELLRAAHALAQTADLLQRRQSDLSESARFSTALASSLDAARIAEQGLRPLANLVGAESGSIYVLDPKTSGGLQQLAAWSAKAGETPALPAASLSAQALRERTPLLVRSLAGGGSTQLAIPMVLHDRPVGVLCLGRAGEFDEEAVRLAEAAAHPLGLSLQNALLHRHVERLALQLQEANDKLQERNALLEARSAEVETQNLTLTRQAEQLAQAGQRKNELLAAVAHELKNPLAAVANAVCLLEEGAARPEAAARARAIIRRQSGYLARLVEDLLDASRIHRGQLQLRRCRADLCEIARHAVEVATPAMRQKEHRLEVVLPAQPLWSEVDPVRLQQVLVNLLYNAAKYTDSGGHVRLELRREGAEALLAVADNGIGLTAESLRQVFDLFVQVDGSDARAQGGLGIGLSLVRQLVQLHGGSVAARSDGPHRGSEFVVRLPALEAAAEPESVPEETPAPPPADPAATRCPGLRVLLVDDDPDMTESMAELLRSWGHEVAIEHQPRRGIEAALAAPPDVILLDIGLPGLDGYQVARELRARLPSSVRTRLVALTGYSQASDRRKAREAGFDLHFSKPVDFEALRVALEAPGERPGPHAALGG